MWFAHHFYLGHILLKHSKHETKHIDHFFAQDILMLKYGSPLPWPRGYTTFFMLNLTEHEISTAHKN